MNFPAYSQSCFRSFKTDAAFVGILLTIVCIISWPGMTAPLLLDDNDQLSHVERFKSWKDCIGPDSYGLFRPFKNFIFYYLQDVSLFNWHAFTLAIYLGAVTAVYALIRRLMDSSIWAFIGTIFWASCPTQVSTMVWMSAVNLSLAMMLSCMCIIFHDRSQTGTSRNAVLSILACLTLFLAQISYETAVMTPALCVLVDLLRKRSIFSRASMARYIALGLVTITYLVIRSHFGAVNSIQRNNIGFEPGMEAWQLSLSAPWFLWKHFSMWMMPPGRIEFCSAYIWGKSASIFELVAAWGWLAIIVGSIFLTWKRLPMAAIGLLWFLAASFPPSNFIPIWSGPIEDYYLFFPGVGLTLLLLGCARALIEWAKSGIEDKYAHRRLIGYSLILIGGVWRILCIPLFWLQADLWNKPVELYLFAEMSRPYQFQLQTSAARELMLMGNLNEAKILAHKSHQTAPWDPSSSMILGYTILKEGDSNGAETYFREALSKSFPGTAISDFSRLHLADALQKQGAESIVVRETLLPLLKNQSGDYHLDAIRMLIDCYMARKQPDNAINAARNAIKLHPNNSQFRKILAEIEKTSPEVSNKK